MKKCLVLTTLLFSMMLCAYAANEALIIDSANAVIETQDNESSLINIDDNMKKAEEIKEAKDMVEAQEKSKRRINLNMKEINHQRALNWTNRRSNSTALPVF